MCSDLRKQYISQPGVPQDSKKAVAIDTVPKETGRSCDRGLAPPVANPQGGYDRCIG